MARKIALISTLLSLFVTVTGSSAGRSQESQPQQDDLRTKIGQIVVTPGGGPNLALADFVARSSGVDGAVNTFNETLRADLDFAAIGGIVGRSLNPKALVPDPASLKFDQWSGDPVKADYVAFGNLQDSSGLVSDVYLFDVKTRQQLIASRHSGDPRRMAHEFADEIVKLLTGNDGIAVMSTLPRAMMWT